MLSLRRVITKGIQTRAAAQAFHSSAPARAEEKEEVAAAEPAAEESEGFFMASIGDWPRAVPMGALLSVPFIGSEAKLKLTLTLYWD